MHDNPSAQLANTPQAQLWRHLVIEDATRRALTSLYPGRAQTKREALVSYPAGPAMIARTLSARNTLVNTTAASVMSWLGYRDGWAAYRQAQPDDVDQAQQVAKP